MRKGLVKLSGPFIPKAESQQCPRVIYLHTSIKHLEPLKNDIPNDCDANAYENVIMTTTHAILQILFNSLALLTAKLSLHTSLLSVMT